VTLDEQLDLVFYAHACSLAAAISPEFISWMNAVVSPCAIFGHVFASETRWFDGRDVRFSRCSRCGYVAKIRGFFTVVP
jgi:hypothetical protein